MYTGFFPVASSWTPVVTFATPGDLNVVYGSQLGSYLRFGNHIFLRFHITCSTFTYTTASGNLQITGIPTAATAGIGNFVGNGLAQGWASAGAIVVPYIAGGASLIQWYLTQSNQAIALLTNTQVASASNPQFYGTIEYRAA